MSVPFKTPEVPKDNPMERQEETRAELPDQVVSDIVDVRTSTEEALEALRKRLPETRLE